MGANKILRKKLRDQLLSPVREFISDSRAVGIVLIVCTAIALTVTNTSWGPGYSGFWETAIHYPFTTIHLPHTILHLINDGLMAIFFFLVGLEIKRELMAGELASIRKSLLPVIAALGGMVVPAGLYLLWCGNTPFSNGWGVPMATDIAFSLGVLSLLGKRAPLSLRIFLTALAIIDDLGGILTIAIFYASAIQWNYLLMAGGIMVILSIFNIIKLRFHAVYIALGLVLWYFIFNSGVHATIAGVLLAFTIPLHRIGRLEHALHDPVSFIILPLFALANTAILLPGNFGSILGSPVNYGILCGLVIGKPLGIFLFSRAAVAFNLTTLPGDLKWMHVLGMGMIAGVGFTMSIFMSTLAFGIPEVQTIAKVSVLIASLIAGIAGFVFLTVTVKKKAAIGG